MLRITKNISIFKNLESINLEQSKITTYSKKYFKQIETQNIKLILNKENLKPRFRKNTYHILLGGTTISGKTTYLNSYLYKAFNEGYLTTIGIDHQTKNLGNTKFKIWDSCAWKGRFDSVIVKYIFKTDGIILLFDLSQKQDFDNLPYCLKMFNDYYELEEFQVLLIGNKSDLKKEVKQEEIDEFLGKEKFIGYFEVSSKTLTKVEESGDFMLRYILEKEKAFPLEKTTKKKKEKK